MKPQLAAEAGTTDSAIRSGGAHNPNSVILSGARSAQSKEPDNFRLTATARTFLPAILAILILALATHPAHAQGCAQCLDSTRATPPAVQAAYRHAIYLLIAAASTIFLIGLYLLRREP